MEKRLEKKLDRLKEDKREIVDKIEDIDEQNPSRGSSAAMGGCAAYILLVLGIFFGGVGLMVIAMGSDLGIGAFILVGILSVALSFFCLKGAYKSFHKANNSVNSSIEISNLKSDLEDIEEEILDTKKTLGYQ